MLPNPPSKAHGFQISKYEKKNFLPPPLPNPGDAHA